MSQLTALQNKRNLTPVIAAGITAIFIRIALFSAILSLNPTGFLEDDSHSYLETTHSIVTEFSYTRNDSPEHSRTPGFPLFLAGATIIGGGIWAAVLFQILFASGTSALTTLMSLKLTHNPAVSFLSGLIVALDVPSIVMSNLVMTETLFTFFLVLSTLFLLFFLRERLKPSYLAFAGVSVGIAVLFRPIAVLLPLFLVPFLLSKNAGINRNLKFACIFLACFLITLSPWLVRNRMAFGKTFLSTISNTNILYYRAAGVYAANHGISFNQAQETLREKARLQTAGKECPVEISKAEGKMGREIILKNPSLYLKNHAASALYMLLAPIRSNIDIQLGLSREGTSVGLWNANSVSDRLRKFSETTSRFTLGAVIYQAAATLFLLAATVVGAVSMFQKSRGLFLFPAAVIFYFCLLSGGPEVYARFRVPVVPYMAVYSAFGIAAITNKLKKGPPGARRLRRERAYT